MLDFDWIGHVIDFIFPDDDAKLAAAAAEANSATRDASTAASAARERGASVEEAKGVEAPASSPASVPHGDAAAASVGVRSQSEPWENDDTGERRPGASPIVKRGVIGEDDGDDGFFDMVEGGASAVSSANVTASSYDRDHESRMPSFDASEAGGGDSTAQPRTAPTPVAPSFTLTRLFLNFFRSAAYYTPSDRCSTNAQAVVSLSSLQVGSNILSTSKKQVRGVCTCCSARWQCSATFFSLHAVYQGFKIGIRDAELHVVDEGEFWVTWRVGACCADETACEWWQTAPLPEVDMMQTLQRYSRALLQPYFSSATRQANGSARTSSAPRSGTAAAKPAPLPALGRMLRGHVDGFVAQHLSPTARAGTATTISAMGTEQPSLGAADDARGRLESIGFVRVAAVNAMDIFIKILPATAPVKDPLVDVKITGGTITLTSCIDSFLTMTDVRVTGWWCMLLRIPILMFGVCTLRCTAGGHGICRRLDIRGADL